MLAVLADVVRFVPPIFILHLRKGMLLTSGMDPILNLDTRHRIHSSSCLFGPHNKLEREDSSEYSVDI